MRSACKGLLAVSRRRRAQHASRNASKNPDAHRPDYSLPHRAKCYADGVMLSGSNQCMWRRPPLLSSICAAQPRAALTAVCGTILLLLAIPAYAAPWIVRAQPTHLVNGAPVLFQVKPSTKLTSRSNAATKTWFSLAGVTFETNPGKYTLDLTGERAAGKASLNFKRTFLV